MKTATLHQEVIVTESEQTQALAKQVPTWIEQARRCKITTVPQHAAAQQTLLALKGSMKDAKAWFKSLKAPIDSVKALLLKKEHEVVDPLEAAIDTTSTEIQRFDRVQRAEADRLQNEREATERARLEAAKAADLALLKAEMAKAKPAEKKELQAVIAEVKAEPVIVAPIVVAPRVAVTPGLATRVTWCAVVTDLVAFRKGLCDGSIPWDAITVNQTWLNARARETKIEGEYYPGVYCQPETSLVGRS